MTCSSHLIICYSMIKAVLLRQRIQKARIYFSGLDRYWIASNTHWNKCMITFTFIPIVPYVYKFIHSIHWTTLQIKSWNAIYILCIFFLILSNSMLLYVSYILFIFYFCVWNYKSTFWWEILSERKTITISWHSTFFFSSFPYFY